MNRDIAWLTEGYTKQDIEKTMGYFNHLRYECDKIIEAQQLWHSTAPEVLAHRICGMVINELWLCRRHAKDE